MRGDPLKHNVVEKHSIKALELYEAHLQLPSYCWKQPNLRFKGFINLRKDSLKFKLKLENPVTSEAAPDPEVHYATPGRLRMLLRCACVRDVDFKAEIILLYK